MPRPRKVLLVIVVGFILYAILKDPTQSATVTGNAWDQIKEGISAIGIFFDTLISS